MTTWKPVFEVDKDIIGVTPVEVTHKSLVSTSGSTTDGDTAILTTATAHSFSVGDIVTIRSVGYPFDGIVTVSTVVDSYNFGYSLASTVLDSTLVSPSGYALSPSPAFVKYPVDDVVFDNAASYTTLMAEAWDYNTIRIVWGVQGPLDSKIKQDIANGLTPRIAVVRSSFGHPVTPLDGEKILDVPYSSVLPSDASGKLISYFESQPAVDNIFKLPPSDTQSLYDRNLTPGSWHYYSLFYFVQGNTDAQHWVLGGSDEAITPGYHGHADKLYDLIPEYYRVKDQEFTYGTGHTGVLRGLINVIGMELDYTKTLADTLEDVYNVDKSNYLFMHLLGETNLGVESEDGLGDIRYRSILSTINTLYDERGSQRALQDLTLAATKYNCKAIEGVNVMCLPDDAEFSDGSGSWGDPVISYPTFSSNVPWMGTTATPHSGGTYLLNNAVISQESSTYSVSDKGGVLVVSADTTAAGYDASYGTVVTCGLGRGYTLDRHKTVSSHEFYPQLNGIRCKPGTVYEFSVYSRLSAGSSGSVAIGVMWFNMPKDPAYSPPKPTAFNIYNDFLKYDAGTYSTAFTVFNESDWTPADMTRLDMTAEAPLSHYGETAVYAVPYIAYDKSNTHEISAAMFNPVLNSAQEFAVESDPYLTLGVSTELLGSTYKLGSA